jgi:hypothetical protein
LNAAKLAARPDGRLVRYEFDFRRWHRHSALHVVLGRARTLLNVPLLSLCERLFLILTIFISKSNSVMNTNLIRRPCAKSIVTALLLGFGAMQVLANQGAPPASVAEAVAPLATIPQYVLPPTDVQGELAADDRSGYVYRCGMLWRGRCKLRQRLSERGNRCPPDGCGDCGSFQAAQPI